MPNGRVCVVGSINMDLVVRAPHLPSPGETILGGPFTTSPGGKGANQAVAAARAGARVAMVGRVGDDAYGVELRTLLEADSIDTTHVVKQPESATGVAVILVEDGTGENVIVVAGGANRSLAPNDIDHAADAIREADVLLMQLEIPLETAVRAAEVARAANVPVILNAAPAISLNADVLSLIDILVVNHGEAEILTGHESAEVSPEDLAKMLLARGLSTVILTLGSRGAIVARGNSVQDVRARKVKAIDTVGAGDAFCGALAASLANGCEIIQAAKIGAVAGSLAVTRSGAMPSLPHVDEINRILNAKESNGSSDRP